MRGILILKRLAYAAAILHCLPGLSLADDDIYASFVDPEPQVRPFARWWWNGSRVNADETIRQLDVTKDAGSIWLDLGEINVIADFLISSTTSMNYIYE